MQDQACSPSSFISLQDSYIRFFKNPLRPGIQLALDFRDIISRNSVQHVGFGTCDVVSIPNAPCFLIGTTHVSIEHSGKTYAIGELIIYLATRQAGFDAPFIRIENVTELDSPFGGPRKKISMFAHPFVNGQPGTLCIGEGYVELYTAMSESNIPAAYSILDAALRSTSSNNGYIPIETWPLMPNT